METKFKRITDALIARTEDLETLIAIKHRLQERLYEYITTRDYEKCWYDADFLNLTSRWEDVAEKIRLIDDEHSEIWAGEGLGYYDIGDVLA